MQGDKMANWEFLPNPGEEEEGRGHAGIETFKGSPYPGIARECSQNSLDAAARQSNGVAKPVHLVFRLLQLPASEIPGLSELKQTLQTCLEQAKAQNIKNDREFFERAARVAAQPKISVLAIEDYGTTGLVGPAVKGTPFHALVKSSGITLKPDADAGGSFGIGKNAAFAISTLRTVFYSTLYETKDGSYFLAQGKSILVSHEENKVPKRATGYWGKTNYQPVESIENIPQWLRRSEIGTTVACVGFVDDQDWHWQMAESLIRNFFSAIQTEAIRFTVYWSTTPPLEINKTSLSDLFQRVEIRRAAENIGTTYDLDFSAAMLEAIKSPETEEFEETFNDIGKLRLFLLQRDGLPRRIGIIRNGMYITDNLRHFGHQMARFPLSRDFVAVLEPADRSTSGKIRELESPRHDEISAERIDDIPERNRRKGAMKRAGTWIRDVIKKMTMAPAEAEILLDEMNRFFAKQSNGTSSADSTNKNDDPERIRLSLRPTSQKPQMGSGKHGESGSSGGQRKTGAGDGRTTGDRLGKGRGAAGGRGGKSIPYSSLRNSVPAHGHGTFRKIAFTPEESGTALLELLAIGVSNDEALAARSIDGLSCNKSPQVALTKGERVNIQIELETSYTGPISMVLTAVEDQTNAN